jgi:hypothetical protein
MESKAGKPANQITMEFLIEFNSQIFNSSGHALLKYTCKGTCSRTVFHYDVTWLEGDFLEHGLTKLTRTGPDGPD